MGSGAEELAGEEREVGDGTVKGAEDWDGDGAVITAEVTACGFGLVPYRLQ